MRAHLVEISPPQRRGAIVRAVISMIVMFFGTIGVYYVIPLSAKEVVARPILVLILAAVAFLAVLAWQVREILRADMPGLRAVQAVVVAVPLFLVGYAALYVILSQQGGFTERLTRTSALYFSVTIFSSVGFGDIAATSDLNRMVVTSQMLAGLVILAAVVRLFFGASRVSLRRRETSSAETGSDKS